MNIVINRPTITRKEIESMLDCLINEELVMGDAIKNFEKNISNLIGLNYSLATNSLSSAYHLSFEALDISEGDEVIMPSYFHLAPLSALSLTRGKVVLADIEKDSYSPSFNQIRERVTDKTKAIVIGHLFGILTDVEELKALNIPIIEDISHAIGAEMNGMSIGKSGTISVASFAPSMMITTGNGGIVLTNNSKLHSKMREKRDNTSNNSISYDYRLTDFQGALGITQLSMLHLFVKRRREIAKRYYDSLRVTPHKTIFPYSDSFVYQSFPVFFDAPIEKTEKYWRKSGIEIKKPISNPLHSFLNINSMDYPNSSRLSKKIYTLPIYPTLTKKEIDKISITISKFI
ncbi:MAG: DegT/DnrJ/EryC1/StrS aminotransferase family protein [Spirochaetota bacterium]|nr:DegT/DnrJ/EryC1/StrS aminotransferase family protein [Spirochaetota bacterium]